MILVIVLIVYFTYYSNSTFEEYLIDHDFLNISVTVESEEEIGSIDDTLLIVLLLILIFF
jgi:hypothetical protein